MGQLTKECSLRKLEAVELSILKQACQRKFLWDLRDWRRKMRKLYFQHFDGYAEKLVLVMKSSIPV